MMTKQIYLELSCFFSILQLVQYNVNDFRRGFRLFIIRIKQAQNYYFSLKQKSLGKPLCEHIPWCDLANLKLCKIGSRHVRQLIKQVAPDSLTNSIETRYYVFWNIFQWLLLRSVLVQPFCHNLLLLPLLRTRTAIIICNYDWRLPKTAQTIRELTSLSKTSILHITRSISRFR